MTEPDSTKDGQLPNQAQHQLSEDVSLHALFGACRTTFTELYLALASEQSEGILLASISDEHGRLGVWGRNSGADRTGRDSLDDRLRNSVKVRDIVAQMLKSLYSCLVKGVEIAKDPSQDETLSGENFDALSSSSGSGSDDEAISSGQLGSSRSPLESLLDVIFGQVQGLYECSTLLRRPAIPDKYIRSVAKDQTSATNTFGPWDRAHVAEKITQWHLDNGRKLEEPLKEDYYLCIRLGAGNTRRREQLKYWSGHPEQGSSTKLNIDALPSAPKELQTSHVQLEALPGTATAVKSVAQSVSASKHTVQSFSTVAQSVLKDTATISGRPKTTYAPSDSGPSATEIRLPDFPKSEPGALTVACPYCFTQLNVKEMTANRQLWKKHVFRDLRPYMCTFQNCTHSEKLYVTRHDWIFHETQMHRRQWACRDCEETLESSSTIEQHMRELHSGNFTENQLPILLDLCERAVDLNKATDCPLCEKTLPLSSLRGKEDLQGHLAWHLEQIALFVIAGDDSDSETNDANSNQAMPGMLHKADETELQNIINVPATDYDVDNVQVDQGRARSASLSLLKQESDLTGKQVQFLSPQHRANTMAETKGSIPTTKTTPDNVPAETEVKSETGKADPPTHIVIVSEATKNEVSSKPSEPPVTQKPPSTLPETRGVEEKQVPKIKTPSPPPYTPREAEEEEVEQQESEKERVFIAVLGRTSTGKTSFINLVTGAKLKVGHKLGSCTEEIQVASAEIDDYIVELIDTPGFDGDRDDADILGMIGDYLGDIGEKVFLRGVIFLHSISDNKFQGSSKRTLDLLKRLSGEENYKNIALTSTMWDTLRSESFGEEREKKLRETGAFWGDMITAGASVYRHKNTKDTAINIVRRMINMEPIVLQFQRELARTGSLGGTSAGQLLIGYLEDETRRYNTQTKDLTEKIKKLEAERTELPEHYEKLSKDLEATNKTIAERTELSEHYEKLSKDLEATEATNKTIAELNKKLETRPKQSWYRCTPQ